VKDNLLPRPRWPRRDGGGESHCHPARRVLPWGPKVSEVGDDVYSNCLMTCNASHQE